MKRSTSQEGQLNENIPVRYILKNNFSCMQVITERLNTRINKIWRILPEDNLQNDPCLEVIVYAKNPIT